MVSGVVMVSDNSSSVDGCILEDYQEDSLILHNKLIPTTSQEVLNFSLQWSLSFSSFPPFSTFPNVEPGPSSINSDSEPSQKRRKSDQVSRTRRKERSERR